MGVFLAEQNDRTAIITSCCCIARIYYSEFKLFIYNV